MHTHWIFYDYIVIRCFRLIDWFHEWPGTFMALKEKLHISDLKKNNNVSTQLPTANFMLSFARYLDLFHQLLEFFILFGTHILHVCEIDGIVLLTIGANIFVNTFGFTLQNAHTTTMEPVLTFVTANIKLRFIVWLTA